MLELSRDAYKLKDYTLSKIKKYQIWMFAVIVIPLITVGYDYLEETAFYDNVTGTIALESAVETLYSGEPGFYNGFFNESLSTNTKEFESLIKIIEAKRDYKEGLVPTFIMRFALNNASYVEIPTDLNENLDYVGSEGGKQLILGTDFSPTILGVCSPDVREIQSQCKIRVVGNRYELERKIEERKAGFRLNFNLAITIISILLAIALETRRNK